MKKIYKNKNFYMAIGIGLLCMLGLVYSVNNKGAKEKLANISKARNTLENNIDNNISSNYVIEDEIIEKKEDNKKENKEIEHKSNNMATKKDVSKQQTVNVIANKASKKSVIMKFDQDKGLSWPINGEIVKDYCVDKLVYFPTLKVYKANPSIFIRGKEGDSVKSASKGIVKKVGKDVELGEFIEVDIGSNYTLLYGQLKDITASKGDILSEGQAIAKIASPSSYYTEEGTHLYFQVKENNEEINPLVFLK